MSTVKNLLVALKHYTSFLTCSGEISESQASTLRNVISQWIFSLRKELSARRTELPEEQSQNLSTIQQAMDHYSKSRFAQRITVFFDEYTGYPVSAEAFACARDHLVVTLLLSNGQHSGVIRNLT